MNENIISRNFETARKMKCYQKENCFINNYIIIGNGFAIYGKHF